MTQHRAGPVPLWARVCLFAAAYAACAESGRHLTPAVTPFVTIWLPSGLFVGVLMRLSPGAWMPFVAASLAANLTFDAWNGQPLSASVLFWSANALEATTGAWIVRRWLGRPPELTTLRDLGVMLSGAILAGPVLGATVGSAAVTWVTRRGAYADNWFAWWSGDMVGVVLIAPLVLTLPARWPGWRRPTNRDAELVAYGLVLALALWWVFDDAMHRDDDLDNLLVLLLAWAAFRYGVGVTALAAFMSGTTAAWMTARNLHVPILATFLPGGGQVALQIQIVVSALAAIALAVVLEERRLAEAHLRYQALLLDQIGDTVTGTDLDGRITYVNEAQCRTVGRPRAELIGAHVAILGSDQSRGATQSEIADVTNAAGHWEGEVVNRAADGSEHLVHVRTARVCDLQGRPIAMIGSGTDVTALRRAEAAERDALARLTLFFDGARDAILVAHADTGHLLDVNDAAARLFGRPKRELVGLHQRDLHPPDQRAYYEGHFRERARQPNAANRSGEILTARGQRVPVEISTSGVTLADGTKAVLGVFRDITDRVRTDRIMQARMRLMEVAATHGLEQLLVATLDEVEALTDSRVGFYHFLKADQRTLSLQAWSTRTTKEMCNAEGKGLHYDVEAAGVWADCIRERRAVIHDDYASLPNRKGLPDGHASVIRELVVPVVRAERIVAILGTGNKPASYTDDDVMTVTQLADLAWDIAERKRAEQALEQSRIELQAIYDHAPVMMCVLDGDREVQYVNRAFEAFIGSPIAAVEPRLAGGVLGCINARDDPRGCGFGANCAECTLRRALADTLITGDSHTGVEYTGRLEIGGVSREIALLGSTARIQAEDAPPLLLLCLVDITEQKRAEEALAASRAELQALSHRLVTTQEESRRELAAELHDRVGQNLTALNLNFAVIQGALPREAADGVRDRLDDSLLLIAESMTHVRDVMADLRPPLLEEFGLGTALRWYGTQVQGRTGLTVEIDAEEGGPRYPAGVETVFFRVAQEAVVNAMRHARARRVRVTLSPDGTGLRLSVADDGVGFRPFEAAASAGLGLRLMRERAQLVGATFDIASIPGDGTTIGLGWTPASAVAQTPTRHA
jgi:PAS domain S-box-containing protein